MTRFLFVLLAVIPICCGGSPVQVDAGSDAGSDASSDGGLTINETPWEEYAEDHSWCVKSCQKWSEWFELCQKGDDLLVDNPPGCTACLVEVHQCDESMCEGEYWDADLAIIQEDCSLPELWRCHPLQWRDSCDGWEDL